MGMTTSASLLLWGDSTAQTGNVTGPKLTSTDTMFTIADYARARVSGDYGNCLTSQAAFTSGRSDRKKANRFTGAPKSPHQPKQSRRKRCSGQRRRLQVAFAGAASMRD